MLRFNHGVSQKAATISTIFGKKKGSPVPSGFSAVTVTCRVPSQLQWKYDGPRSLSGRSADATPTSNAFDTPRQSEF
jgi:hypothetical protein